MPAAPHIPQLLGGFAIRGIADLPPLIRKSPYKTSPYSGGLFVLVLVKGTIYHKRGVLQGTPQ